MVCVVDKIDTSDLVTIDLDLWKDILGTPDSHPVSPSPNEAPGERNWMPWQQQQQQLVMPAPIPLHPTVQQSAAIHSHGQVNDFPVMDLSQGMQGNGAQVTMLNGKRVYVIPSHTGPSLAPFVPPVNPRTPQRRGYRRQVHDYRKPCVKKPQDAFMNYLKQQMPKVVAELGSADCATVTRLIGQRWKSLSVLEQQKYH